MRTQKKIEKHVAEHWDQDKLICDLCQKVGNGWRYAPWGDSSWDCSQIEIEASIGNSFPEADCRKSYALDVCPQCFIDKLKPLIEKTFGVKFTEFHTEDGYPYTRNEETNGSDLGG